MVFHLPFVHRLMTGAFSVAALLLLAACGGGGGGSAYSLSVNPTSIAFTAERDGALPSAQSIHASFKGDGLIVGYPTGVTPPTWLSAGMVSSTSSSATASLQVSSTALPAGSYATTLRFVTGKADGTHLVTRDVPITYRVTQGLRATQTAFTFTASEGGTPAAQTLNLNSDLVPYAWSLTVEPSGAGPTDWLTVSTPTGNASAPTAIQVLAASRPRGTYGANLVLRNGSGTVKATIPVAYTVHGAFDLAGTFSLNLNQGSTAAALDVPMTLQTRLASGAGAAQHWQITSDQPWLTVSPASGDLSANTSLTAHLNPALMGSLPNGASTATLTVHLTTSSYSDLSVPFVLNLNLPQVAHVAPYATWVGRTSPVILRGSGFPSGTTVPVQFGTAVATGTVVSDSEIHVTAPSSLTASRLTVSVENALGIARTGADLLVLPQPGYTAASIDLPYGSRGMIQDPERQALLLVDGSSIQRIRFRNGAWSQDSLPLPSASGIFVGLDGKDLFATAGNVNINDELLRLDPETFATREVKTIDDYYQSYSLVAGFNDGRIYVFGSDQWLWARQYPDMNQVNAPSVHGAIMLMTRDRSRLLLHTTTSSGMDWYCWDASASGYTLLGYGDSIDRRAWSISSDGGRLLKGLSIFNHSFQKLGDIVIPEPTLLTAALSPDGTRAYTIGWVSGSTFALRRTDLSAATGPYVADATPLTLDLGWGESPDQIQVSEDGSTLFLLIYKNSGGQRFVAMPLP